MLEVERATPDLQAHGPALAEEKTLPLLEVSAESLAFTHSSFDSSVQFTYQLSTVPSPRELSKTVFLIRVAPVFIHRARNGSRLMKHL